MTTGQVTGVRIAGIVTALPQTQETTADLAARFGEAAAERIARATGIHARRRAAAGQCASDLAAAAARDLLMALGWEPESIGVLLMVSQTHDHLLPATACLLHERLGLGRHCAAFDLGLGCSGYVYGLWLASTVLAAQPPGQRALLLAGDTTTRLIAPDDRAVAPLFGDAAAATALERLGPGDGHPFAFTLGSDGTGAPYLMVPGGGLRYPPGTPGVSPHLFMDGTQVFAFTLREVPTSIAAVLELAGWPLGTVDHLVLHQANAQMLRHLGQRLGARPEQLLVALEEVGNTSSASIPLALTLGLGESLTHGPDRRLVLSGFGVGWSWGSAALLCPPLAVCRNLIA